MSSIAGDKGGKGSVGIREMAVKIDRKEGTGRLG